MGANGTVNTGQFNAMCDQGARLTATRHEDFLANEVARVLEGAVRNTKVASVQRIKARYQEFVPLGMDAYSPKRTRRYGNVVGGKNLIYNMKNRYPNELWAALQSRRTQLINRKRGARGLARRAWLELAEAAGLKIDVPGYVAAAVPSTGKTYQNAAVEKTMTDAKIAITISTSQPTVVNTGGERALQRAIDGRVKYFQRNADNAVFAEVARIAKAYPGLKITTNG